MIYCGLVMRMSSQGRIRAIRAKNRIMPAPALERGLCILEDLHAQPADQSARAIAERLSLPINSTLRLLRTRFSASALAGATESERVDGFGNGG